MTNFPSSSNEPSSTTTLLAREQLIFPWRAGALFVFHRRPKGLPGFLRFSSPNFSSKVLSWVPFLCYQCGKIAEIEFGI